MPSFLTPLLFSYCSVSCSYDFERLHYRLLLPSGFKLSLPGNRSRAGGGLLVAYLIHASLLQILVNQMRRCQGDLDTAL